MILRGRGRRLAILSEASAVIFLYCVGAGALWFILPPIAENLVGNLALVGLLLAIPAVAGMLLDMPLGDLCDKIEKKSLLYIALAVMIAAGILLPQVTSLLRLIILLAAAGAVSSTLYIVTTTYVLVASPKRYSSSFLGTYTSFVHFGYSVGALLAGVAVADAVLDNTPRIGFVILASCVLAACATATLTSHRRKCMTGGISSVLRDDQVFMKEIGEFRKLGFAGAAIVGLTVLFTLYDGIVWTLEPLLYQHLGIGSVYGGVILAAFVVPLIVFEAPAGYLADRFGKRRLLFAGLLMGGVFSVFFSRGQSAAALIAFAFAATTGLALAWPALEGILAEHTQKRQAGEFAGVWITAKDAGYVAGPILGGVLAQAAGIRTVFLLAGVALTASAAVVLLFSKSR